ncbi:PKD domain-containing protein [Microbacterium sp.]|uniref:PKD domain-containing protein n=1 Tax=Microbacterium sp. TaxID=51671 RepID=UPI003F713FBC
MGSSESSSRTFHRRRPLTALVFATIVAVAGSLLAAAPASAAAPSDAVLVSPADGTVSSTPDPQLRVNVSDSDGDPLTVTFEGRRKGATVPGPTDADPFTFAVIPDTQNYTSNGPTAPIIAQQAQWLVDTRTTLNTQFVVQVGDLVNDWPNATQWQRVSNGLKVLDDNGMPNAVVPGNHDFDNATGAHTAYDTWFPPSRYQNAIWTPSTARYGGYMGQNQFGADAEDRANMNNYSLFTAGGVDWLVLGLEWEASADALAWADRVLAAHPGRQVIMFTHAFVNLPGSRRTFAQRPGGTPPETTWGSFVRTHCQVRLVVNGHEHAGDLGEARRTDDNACGKPVHQILSDYQARANGGNGWLRYYRFDPPTGTMTAVTYSPYLNQYETDADSAFTLPFLLSPPVAAPFTTISTVTASSGTTAGASWPSLLRDTDYEWRVRVSDGSATTTSSTWTVRTPPEDTVLRDDFSRTSTAGWGVADSGQTWTPTGSGFSTDGASGRMTIAPGQRRDVSAGAATGADASILTSLAITPTPTGSATYTSVWARRSVAGDYRATVTFRVNGQAPDVTLSRKVGPTETNIATFRMPAALATGARVNLRFETEGSSPTKLRARAWVGAVEPSTWNLDTTDATATLQVASGGLGLSTYVSSTSASASTVIVDSILATRLGSVPPPVNAAPVAAIAVTSQSGRTVALSGAGSSDADGTISSYAWAFGDGTTAAGSAASRTYTSDGTYTISLTVTDDDGASATTNTSVTVAAVPPPNQAPVAAFTSSVAGLAVSVDGATSADTDGTIASYAWTFGDGATATTRAASHTYPSAGTYSVSLLVTDDDGATNTTSTTITVTAPPISGVLARDLFERTGANGWGTADQGGAWAISGAASRFSVASGSGIISLNTSTGQQAVLPAVSSTSTRVATTFSVDKIAAAQYISVIGRQVGSEQYLLRLRVGADGGATLLAMRGGTAIGANYVVPGLTITPGALYNVVFDVTGTAPTTLSAKMWRSGTTEPASWQFTRTDSTAALQAAGSVGLFSYVPTAANAFPVALSFSEFTVTDPNGGPPPPNVAPTANFTTSAMGLTASVNGSTSTDADGTIASYAWAFGDGATASGATSSHAYTAAGTYTITLTVTDDDGATSATSAPITVVAQPVSGNVLAKDLFERSGANGWGSADQGGAWSVTGTAARFSVAGGAGVVSITTGQGQNANLTAVSSAFTRVVAEFSVDKVVEGHYIAVVGRQVGAAQYILRMRPEAGGALRLYVLRDGNLLGSAILVPGLMVTPGQKYTVAFEVTGTSPTTLNAKVWRSGDAEPGWQATRTDSAVGMQTAGSIGVFTWLPSSATASNPVAVAFWSLVATDTRGP